MERHHDDARSRLDGRPPLCAAGVRALDDSPRAADAADEKHALRRLALEWGAYLLLDFFYSYTIAKEKGWKFLPVEIILYPAFHFAYGFGSLCGIAALPKFVRAEKEKKKAGDGR